ncbi:MAG: hypothetical protein ACHREM_09250 [Polyangiales bacterium]
MTNADKFFLGSYLVLLVNLGFSVLMLRAEDAKNEARVNGLFKAALWVLPVLTIASMVVAVVT